MANNIDVKDATSTTKTMKTTDTASVHTSHVNVDAVIPGTAATNLGKAEDAAHASGDTGIMALAVRKDTAAISSGTTGDYEPLSTDALGRLRVEISGPGAADSILKAEDAAHASGDVGPAVMAVRQDTDAAGSGTDNDYECLKVTGGRLKTQAKQVAVTDGGTTPSKTISAASTNATSVKASAGNLYGLHASNINAAVRYLKLYNKASAPTVGTDTPVMTLAIPGATTGGRLDVEFAMPLSFATGIAFALTTGVADSDTGAVAANEQVVNLSYK